MIRPIYGSNVDICSSSSTGGERNIHSFGAIGDQRSPRPGLLSAPLPYTGLAQLSVRNSHLAGHCQQASPYDLTYDTNRYHENLKHPMKDGGNSRSSTHRPASAGESPWHQQLRGRTTIDHPPYPTLHDLVDDSTPDIDQYEHLLESELELPGQSIAPHRLVPSNLHFKTPRSHSTEDLKETLTPSLLYTSKALTIPLPSQERASFDTLSYGNTLLFDNTSESVCLIAPIWWRRGPSIAFSAGTLATLCRSVQFESPLPRFAHEYLYADEFGVFQDKLDPQNFCLPYGSVIFSIKDDNIKNLQMSVSKGVWTSTLGSNLVLTEAWARMKPPEKLILLFAVTHSPRHSGKYLGMAEMMGPLDLGADCTFWPDKKPGTRGLIPVRWILTKDVPFSRFYDLRYHDQPIAYVRHGNTIPGEVGRLAIQRYFEATHGPTATLHPLSQSFLDTEPPPIPSTLGVPRGTIWRGGYRTPQ